MRRYRTESEPEPWIEQLIQHYGSEQQGASVRAHVVGVSDLTESQCTGTSDACMLFLSDGTVFIPAVLSAAAWEHMQELEERDTFSGLDNTTVSVRNFQLKFNMDPELRTCQFYLAINQLISVGRVSRHQRPPSCTVLSSVKQQILKTWRSLMKENSVTCLSSQSGLPLSCLMGEWHKDIIMDLLNEAMKKLAKPTAGNLGRATPTHWHQERLRCRAEECFSTPVSHLLIPGEQRKMLTADPGVSNSSATQSGPASLHEAETMERPITAQDRGGDSSAAASDRPENEQRLDLKNTRAGLLQWLSQPVSRSLLTDESTIILSPLQRPHPTPHSPAHQHHPITTDLHPLTSEHTAAVCVEQSLADAPQNTSHHVSHIPPAKKSRSQVHSDGSSFSYTYKPSANVASALSRTEVPQQLLQWAVAYLGTSPRSLIVHSGPKQRKISMSK